MRWCSAATLYIFKFNYVSENTLTREWILQPQFGEKEFNSERTDWWANS